jgi:hypothetical protein
MIAVEEQNIRTNISARTSVLMQKFLQLKIKKITRKQMQVATTISCT